MRMPFLLWLRSFLHAHSDVTCLQMKQRREGGSWHLRVLLKRAADQQWCYGEGWAYGHLDHVDVEWMGMDTHTYHATWERFQTDCQVFFAVLALRCPIDDFAFAPLELTPDEEAAA